MEFKLLVMVQNLCARDIIQNAVQGISKVTALFLNKNKIKCCFPKFQVYKHIASKMRSSEIIVDWEISCLQADDHLVHAHLSIASEGCPCGLLGVNLPPVAICLVHVCLQILFVYNILYIRQFVCLPFVRTIFASFFCFFLALFY